MLKEYQDFGSAINVSCVDAAVFAFVPVADGRSQ